jgi:hypothetical protein
MRDRFLALTAALAAMIALGLAPLWAQAVKAPSTTPGAKWTAPRTPWGDPDLQGEWTGMTPTPLERPDEGRVVITDPVELARLYDLDPEETGRGVGTYNAFWREYGQPVSGQPSLIIDPPDGKLPPMTPEAQKRRADNAARRNADGSERPPAGPEDRSARERCLNWDILIQGSVSTWYRIVQTPGYVAINQYRMHDMRLIPLDGRPHLPGNARAWVGDSRGRWEGDTLVVDTTNFNGKTTFQGTSANLHLIERYTRTGPDTIDYTATVNDPTVWTKPWTMRNPLRSDTEGFYEYACHEGNHALTGILSGARAEEKKAAAAGVAK